jgi:ABC-2 type transport system permease protein
MQAGSITWFALHEWRLAWRDWRVLVGSQSRGRTGAKILILVMIAVLLHVIAGIALQPDPALETAPSKQALVTITAAALLSWSLMLSQAMEATTRAFYVRGDLDLILSSPVAVWRLFAVRIATMAVTTMLMMLVLAAPFINIMALRNGSRWLAAYPAMVSLAMIGVALAIVIIAGMFRTIGPQRTRLIAQIVAAFVGAIFFVGLQFAAILAYGRPDRLAFLQSDTVISIVPEPGSLLWCLAYAMMGHAIPLAVLAGTGVLSLGVVIAVFAPRFGLFVLAAAGVAEAPARRGGYRSRFRNTSSAQGLRRKEWILLRRDPWLVSQTLVQIIYLLPAAYLLWRGFRSIEAVTLLVPLLVTAAGQFAGGLAWLAISGEDAPDLIRTAPVLARSVLRAKFEAVIGATMAVLAPFLLAMAAISLRAAMAAAAGIVVAGAAATAIQYWFRLQAHRGRIRRRQTASRLTTYAEALSSISWAGAAALVTAGLWLALVPVVVGCLTVGGAWLISPARGKLTIA